MLTRFMSSSTNLQPVYQSIVSKLSYRFNPSHLEVINESFMHNVPSVTIKHFISLKKKTLKASMYIFLLGFAFPWKLFSIEIIRILGRFCFVIGAWVLNGRKFKPFFVHVVLFTFFYTDMLFFLLGFWNTFQVRF